MDIIKANIDNLASLWRAGGHSAGQYIEEDGYSLSLAEKGEWPNRIWFTQPLNMKALNQILHKWNLDNLSVAAWGGDLINQELMLKATGFEEKLTQIAMSISLEDVPDTEEHMYIQKVTSESLTTVWTDLFQGAFNYEIHTETVIKTMKSIDYFIGYHNGIPIGTALLYINEKNIAGLHSMGIIPSQRRKGYAEKLLKQMLKNAEVKGATHVTLQASDMGKGLYLKTGFREDFEIKTFTKHKK